MKLKKISVRFLYILIDVFAAGLAIYWACLLRPGTLPFEISFYNLFLNDANPLQSIFIIWIFATVFFAMIHGLYKTERGLQMGTEAVAELKTVFLSTVTVVLAIFAFKAHLLPRTVLVIAAILNFGFIFLWRVVKRFIVEDMVRRGYNNFNVLIVGAGKVGEALVREINKSPALGLRVVGFLDDYKTEPVLGVPVLGKISDFPRVAEHEFVNVLFIGIHHDSQVFLNLLEKANDLKIAVRVVPQGFDLMSGDCTQFYVGYIPVWEYSPVIPFRKQAGKRLFDLMASGIGLLVMFPVFLFFAVWIKLDSRGSVFYLCERYGRDGRKFKMFKFRTMCADAHRQLAQLREKNEVDGPIFKMKDDPRVTNVGKFLRKYSLDELPQLINVFNGTMSLVGPRPFPIEQIEKHDLKQLRRLKVRPGITGLWQIRGRSDVSSFAKLLRWDLWYINNWSFWLDLKILLNTIPVVVKGKGAY